MQDKTYIPYEPIYSDDQARYLLNNVNVFANSITVYNIGFLAI